MKDGTDERRALLRGRLLGLAETLIGDFDVIELFENLVDMVVEALPVDEAGLLLRDEHDEPILVATTDTSARYLELFQLSDRDGGPCLASMELGKHVAVPDLGLADQEWPHYAASAVAAGFHSVDAIPLLLHGEVLGALNLFRRSPGGLDAQEVAVARALANLGTMGIVLQLSASHAAVVVGQLRRALEQRVVIEQAKGIIAHHAGASVAEAFSALRSYARSHQRRLALVASAVIDGSLDPDEVLATAADQPTS